ncbi:DUF664 domain-containing protein [Streptomyces lycii]|uniref:DUF664 domain-containing protein n=1 Tax=Streptomyces lycii TaxID=2654337 RepID=UPI000BF681EB|nr:hypothetical protein CRI70_03130 [Streptomyces sp. Ru87]
MTRIDDTPPAWDERTTARHNGHLDILREMLDGTTGRPILPDTTGGAGAEVGGEVGSEAGA